jgi:hypothetical protein
MSAVALLACNPALALDDHFVQCRAADPEILDDLMTYQLGDSLYVQRLIAAPDPAGPFLRGGPLRLDRGLASSGLTTNGPEIGLDDAVGYVVVYTKQDAQQRWSVARAAYACEPSGSNACFVRANWGLRSFSNLGALDNRSRPFVSALPSEVAWVSYLWALDTQPPPNDAPIARPAWRRLEDPNNQETLVRDDSVDSSGKWVEVDGRVWLLGSIGADGVPDTQVALADPDVVPPVFTSITSGTGVRGEAAVWFDPASGSYLLSYRWRAAPVTTSNEMRVHRRDETTGAWSAEPFLTFTAIDAEGDPTTPRVWILSNEPFVDGAGNSYLAFSTGDQASFSSVTDGNVWYVNVDAAGATQPQFVRVNETTNVTNRMEPELHYPSNDGPVVFYTQIAQPGDPQCQPNDPTVRRARTGLTALSRTVR